MILAHCGGEGGYKPFSLALISSVASTIPPHTTGVTDCVRELHHCEETECCEGWL